MNRESKRRESNPSEASIVRACLRALNALPRSRWVKRHGSAYTRIGEPDLDGVIDGQAYKIEVKRPGKKATPAQLQQLERWRRAGAVVGVVHSAEGALELLSLRLPEHDKPV